MHREPSQRELTIAWDDGSIFTQMQCGLKLTPMSAVLETPPPGTARHSFLNRAGNDRNHVAFDLPRAHRVPVSIRPSSTCHIPNVILHVLQMTSGQQGKDAPPPNELGRTLAGGIPFLWSGGLFAPRSTRARHLSLRYVLRISGLRTIASPFCGSVMSTLWQVTKSSSISFCVSLVLQFVLRPGGRSCRFVLRPSKPVQKTRVRLIA